MPSFIVKTLGDRNLVIEADRFRLTQALTQADFVGFFEFIKKDADTRETKVVALVPIHNVFAVVEEDAEIVDFYQQEDLDDGSRSETRAADLVETDTFTNAVVEIVDSWHEVVGQPKDEEPALEYRYVFGKPLWGFVYDGSFAPFGSKESAEGGLEQHISGECTKWFTQPVEICPLVEEGE